MLILMYKKARFQCTMWCTDGAAGVGTGDRGGGRAAGLFSLRGHRPAPRHWEGGEGGKGAARGGVEWSKACADLVGLRVGLP